MSTVFTNKRRFIKKCIWFNINATKFFVKRKKRVYDLRWCLWKLILVYFLLTRIWQKSLMPLAIKKKQENMSVFPEIIREDVC